MWSSCGVAMAWWGEAMVWSRTRWRGGDGGEAGDRYEATVRWRADSRRAVKMMLPPTVDTDVLGRVQPKLAVGLDDYPRRWWNFLHPIYGFHVVSHTRHIRSSCATKRTFVTLNAISRKKERGQVHKSKDLDDDGTLLTEADLNYKPLGFGQGKTYDISLEDKLFEQIELTKATQAAALSSQRTKVASKKLVAESKHAATTVGCIKVSVGDLPKKRNIDRDLRSAFGHIPGLLDISPSVHGNEKTRDPLCKGSAVVMFDTVDHATSFISSFQGRPIRFGKVEKELSFSIMNANGAEDMSSSDRKGSSQASKLRVRDKEVGVLVGSRTRPGSGSPRVAELSISVDTMPSRNPTQSFQQQVDVTQHEEEMHDETTGGSLRIADLSISVDNMQDGNPTQSFQPQVDVRQDEEGIQSDQEYDETTGEEESDHDSELDNETEIEISVQIEDQSVDNDAIRSGQGRIEEKKLTEAEIYIEKLEERLKKKLSAGRKQEEKMIRKPRGFSPKKDKSPRQAASKGNNIAAVTHGLRRREREVMAGVLEKYGRNTSASRP